MNIIAATLLLFLEEEDAFYLFVSIIEKIPEYYEKSLLGAKCALIVILFIGAIVDIRVFGDLLEEKLPELAAHLKDIHADLTLVGKKQAPLFETANLSVKSPEHSIPLHLLIRICVL